MIKVFVTLVIIVKKKKILIGKKENLNFKNYAINIEKLMVNMIVLFLAQVEKTVFLHLIF